MKKIKIIVSVILVLSVMSSAGNMLCYAQTDDFYAQYSGSTDASWGYKPYCTFTIDKIVNNEFRGRFSATNLGAYSFDEPVSGKVYFGRNSLTCVFTVNFYNGRYYSNITASIDKLEGTCECFCSGSWHLEDFIMTGTKFIYPTGFGVNQSFTLYSEDDMKICMDLCDAIYGDKDIKSSDREYATKILKKFSNTCRKYNLKDDEELVSYNILDSNKNNTFFAITNRTNYDGSVDIVVTVRGTLKDEWQGNTEITGTSYDQNKIVHDNFNVAKDSIKTAIELYYRDIADRSETINLIITGHSRGAAIANLYAKEATDAQTTTLDCGIPRFSSVTAYTFACPNVEKYNSTMEGYTNIFNFCFNEDLVTTVPLTEPTDGWNYWKYGQTYVCNLSEYNNQINKNTVSDIHNAFSAWEDVESYYESCITVIPSTITLYKLAHDTTGAFMSYSITHRRNVDILCVMRDVLLLDTYDYKTRKLLYTAIANFKSIGTAHDYLTYNSIINGTMNTSTGDDVFFHCSYDSLLQNMGVSNYQLQQNNNSSSLYSVDDLNSSNISQLTLFANQSNNLSILGWDLDDPSTWEGITWNADGNVESIDLSFKNLSGQLDLSGFSSLKSLDLSGNEITDVTLSNCSSLEEIDCSFNNLTSLDLSDCTSLTSVTCCYNYLDTHEGGTLYNTLDDLMFNDCYVNYYPQAVPENATFNTTELNALKTFANTDNNESVLDWLDDDGNIDTEKLQNNVLFEYDGSNYRVVAIDVSELDVSGALNLTSLSLLQDVYCENTKITSLNVNGCTKLETLQCDGCNITTLTLPSNAADKNTPLYDVSCEYNYIDTSIFTPTIVEYVNFKAGANLEYENQKGDSSALQAALSFANELEEKDYSASTYETLKELLDECNYYNFDNLYLTQSDIDDLTTEILTAMYELKAYFNVNISAPNGSFTIAYDDELFTDTAKHSLLYGTNVTLNAIPNEGYSFVGWYDITNNLYLSNNTQYTFRVSSNSKFKAIFVPEGSATLTFANYSNWIAGTVTKTTQEWAELTTIADLLPEVPYKYGYSNGRWSYNEQEILTKLRAGENVLIGAVYDEDDTSLPIPREATDKPVLDLYYKYDTANTTGSFVMASGFPEDIQIESVGIAFYYKDADKFNPTDNFLLLLNNKMLTGRFNTDEIEDIYIVNVRQMTSRYNWAARGFVTYHDANGDLITEYSNQINIINTRNADEILFNSIQSPGGDINNNPPSGENNDNNPPLTGIEDIYVDFD